MLKGNLALPAILFGFIFYAYKVGVLSEIKKVFKME